MRERSCRAQRPCVRSASLESGDALCVPSKSTNAKRETVGSLLLMKASSYKRTDENNSRFGVVKTLLRYCSFYPCIGTYCCIVSELWRFFPHSQIAVRVELVFFRITPLANIMVRSFRDGLFLFSRCLDQKSSRRPVFVLVMFCRKQIVPCFPE